MSAAGAPHRNRGVYLLLLRLPRAAEWPVAGRTRKFPSGYYAYVGSARGGLAQRLARHVRTSQTVHWHVDALLARGTVRDIQVRLTDNPEAECSLAREVACWPDAHPVPGFGAGDCRCPTHLVRFSRRPGMSLLADWVRERLPDTFREMRQRYVNHAAFDRDPFETLVSCILSLRTQDPVTDAAAARLFREMRTPPEFAVADPTRIAQLIYPVGMYRAKAVRLVEIARMLQERFGGSVPEEIDDLLRLPGVGRKTANLVRSFAYHKPAICVDTHVHRIANRWGLVRTATPDETEATLRHVLPKPFWQEINAFLVQHGQQICRPTRPHCTDCPIADGCAYPCLRRHHALLEPIPNAPAHPSLRFADPANRPPQPRTRRSPFE